MPRDWGKVHSRQPEKGEIVSRRRYTRSAHQRNRDMDQSKKPSWAQ